MTDDFISLVTREELGRCCETEAHDGRPFPAMTIVKRSLGQVQGLLLATTPYYPPPCSVVSDS